MCSAYYDMAYYVLPDDIGHLHTLIDTISYLTSLNHHFFFDTLSKKKII